MNRLLPGVLLGLVAAAQAQPSERMLDAVRQVESGGRSSTVSPKGAHGPYQFMRATWADQTDRPYADATDPAVSREVARRYLWWIERTLSRWMGCKPTESQVLASWNGGVGRLRKCGYDVSKMPVESREFARRVLFLESK